MDLGDDRALAIAAARAQLLADVSLEATPTQLARRGDLADRLPAGTAVYLPALDKVPEAARVEAAAGLVRAGLRPVPHLAARRLAGTGELDDVLGAWRDVGVADVLLIAGDLARPAGAFTSTLDVLATGLLERHGVRRLGVAGHPEGHPAADRGTLAAALEAKLAYARATGTEMWIVTQFAFEAGPLAAFEARLRDEGVTLPVRAGLPGPASTRTLMTYAWQCGVAVSARVLARRPSAARLLGRWAPDAVVDALAAHRADAPASLIGGLHLFPFGGLEAALDWRDDAARRVATIAECER
jgi:methylenetetrahydrofolate reductase (NADPH)